MAESAYNRAKYPKPMSTHLLFLSLIVVLISVLIIKGLFVVETAAVRVK